MSRSRGGLASAHHIFFIFAFSLSIYATFVILHYQMAPSTPYAHINLMSQGSSRGKRGSRLAGEHLEIRDAVEPPSQPKNQARSQPSSSIDGSSKAARPPRPAAPETRRSDPTKTHPNIKPPHSSSSSAPPLPPEPRTPAGGHAMPRKAAGFSQQSGSSSRRPDSKASSASAPHPAHNKNHLQDHKNQIKEKPRDEQEEREHRRKEEEQQQQQRRQHQQEQERRQRQRQQKEEQDRRRQQQEEQQRKVQRQKKLWREEDSSKPPAFASKVNAGSGAAEKAAPAPQPGSKQEDTIQGEDVDSQAIDSSSSSSSASASTTTEVEPSKTVAATSSHQAEVEAVSTSHAAKPQEKKPPQPLPQPPAEVQEVKQEEEEPPSAPVPLPQQRQQEPEEPQDEEGEAALPPAPEEGSAVSATRSIVRLDDSWDRKRLNSYGYEVRERGPCGQHWPAGEEAMIVRMCCELTESKKETIRHYSDELRGMDFWVLYDYKDLGEGAISAVEEEFRRLQVDYQFSVFMYNTKLAERMYPAARDRLEEMSGQVNWAIHEVSVAAWWRVCAKHSWGDRGEVHEPLPTAVWSIEADAAYSGDVMTFFDYYRPYKEDFITGWTAKAQKPWIEEKYEKLPKMSAIPFDAIYSKPDAVMRMSSRLLYHMDSALRCNLILYGEMYASTMCRGVFADWCTVRALVDGPFYSPEPGGFNSVHFLTAEEWEKANKEPSLRNRWFHPIAALKEHK